MAGIDSRNTRLESYVQIAEQIKSKIKDVAENKNLVVEEEVDTPLSVLEKIDLGTGLYNVEFVDNENNTQKMHIFEADYIREGDIFMAYASPQSGVTYTQVSDLSGYSDEKIAEISKAISNCSDITSSTETVYFSDATSISVGATRNYTLTTNELMTDRILGFNHDTLSSQTAYGEETTTHKAGITWSMVNCLATRYRMNVTDTNAGGWNVCEMRTTTLPTIKLTMPQSLQNIIKTVDKITANGGIGNYTATVTSQDQLFLIAEIELYGSNTQANHGEGEGSIYKYWALHTNNTDKIKKYLKDNVMQDTQWWQRSCYYIDNNRFTCTYIAGDSGYIGAEKTRGLSFLYCT